MLMEKVGLHKWQDGNQYNAVLLDLYDSMTLMGIEDGWDLRNDQMIGLALGQRLMGGAVMSWPLPQNAQATPTPSLSPRQSSIIG